MNNAMKVRQKPVVLEALQFTGANANACAEFTGEDLGGIPYGTACDFYEIETSSDDVLHFWRGDWIVRDVGGEFFRVSADVFAQTYEAHHDD